MVCLILTTLLFFTYGPHCHDGRCLNSGLLSLDAEVNLPYTAKTKE